MAEIRRESNFRSEKLFLMIKKVILASLNANSGGKHQNSINRSLVEIRLYDVISLKIEQKIL